MINVPKGLAPHEVDLYISAFKFCEKLIQEQNTDIGAAVTETTEKYSFIISDKELFAQFLFREITAYTEPSIGVVSPELDDKTWWSKLKKTEKFIPEYWQRYYDYLNRKPSWSLTAVQDIDSSTDEIMNALANPRSGRACDRMGMVFGYVQSGKTAHYIGLINKAVDAGYRIVVVLTGIHNSLRSQTQSRIDEEVLGYETSLENLADMIREPNVIGVGIGAHNRVKTIVQSITTRDEKGDVNKTTEGVSMVPPFIIVTKKNATVLRRILRFFRKNQCAEVIDGKKIITAKYPALIIDDEADQASINTNDSYDEKGNLLDDYNPTTINGLIREILKTFECRSYVGYTATPFANIFIPPHINSERYGTDLFPRDFVFRTPRADQYIGAREFFGLSGDENTPVMPLCRDIIAGASYLGKGTKAGDPVGNIPEELKKAVKCFLISTALRNCRGQINKPNTMLIHIVRFVSQQNAVKKKVAAYYQDELANFIRYGDSGIYDELKTIWENDYLETTAALRSQFSKYMSDCADIEWDDIWDEIRRIVAKKEIKIYSVNGKSEDALLYKNNEGKPFNVIVIGGDKLSRGLTLEGLTINTLTYMRGAFFSVDAKATANQFPRWKGVDIVIAKLPAYGTDQEYVNVMQLPGSATDIFEIVIENLRSELEKCSVAEDSFAVIAAVLTKWREFFKTDKDLIMSEERQQGLYGELLFLEECLEVMKTNTYTDAARTQNTIYLRLNYDEPSGTVVNVRKSMWIHPTQDRAISVREAARLQTFPDSFVFCGSKDKQYQQVGNAVPPIMAKSIAEKLAQILEKNLAGRERNG